MLRVIIYKQSGMEKQNGGWQIFFFTAIKQ